MNEILELLGAVTTIMFAESAPFFDAFAKSIDKNNTSRYDELHNGRYTMDIQLKRGLLDVCVLSAIKSEDSYGY